MDKLSLNPIIDAIDDFYRVPVRTKRTKPSGDTMSRYENFLSKAKQARETVTMETLRKENVDLARELSSMANAFEASEIRVRWLEAENKHLRELLAGKNVSK